MNDQDHRVALFRPWEKIDADDRWLALETAAEIIFSDKSAVVRHGNGWLPDYRRMRNFAGGEPEADCDRGTQKVNGQMIFTPYCQDEYLSEVAREYGFTTPAAKLRNNPNFKKEICRFVFQDIRVQITCMQAGIPEYRR